LLLDAPFERKVIIAAMGFACAIRPAQKTAETRAPSGCSSGS